MLDFSSIGRKIQNIFPFFQLTVSQTSFSKFLLYPLEQESSVTFVCLTFLLYSFRLDRIFVLHSLLYQDRLYTFSLFFVIICFTSLLSLCSMPSRLRFNADYCELAVCEGGSFNFSYYWICRNDITAECGCDLAQVQAFTPADPVQVLFPLCLTLYCCVCRSSHLIKVLLIYGDNP